MPPKNWPIRQGSPTLRLVGSTLNSDQEVPVRLTGPTDFLPPADLILLTTKAHDADRAAEQAAPALIEGGAAILLSNGLGLEKDVAQHLPKNTLIRGLVYGGASLEAPGNARSNGEGKIVLGIWEPKVSDYGSLDKSFKIAVETLQEAGLQTEISTNPKRSVWEKTMANLAINPLGALARVRNGIVGTDPYLRSVAVELLSEACEVAASDGVMIGSTEAENIFHNATSQTAENKNSMLNDIETGRTTEIDYLNGYVARMGALRNLPVPMNTTVTVLVKALHPEGKSNN